MSKRVFFGCATKGAWILMVAMMLQSCGFVKDKFGGKNSKGGKGGKKGAKQEVGVRNGEIIATGRKDYKQDTPFGMVLIPSGSFMMGQADEDVAATQVNFNRRVTITSFYMDDTEVTNNEYRQFVASLMTDSLSVLGEEEIISKYHPDTTVWKKDFTYHNGDPMLEYYYSHPAFDTYPVVGVSWKAARYFSEWRSNLYNDYRAKEGKYRSPKFRLPTEAEWEWAARGGRASAKYPWGNPYVANGKGCFLANFKPQRGNYDADGYPYTAPANAYNANDYGLYNMAGNVAEWTLDAYADNATIVNWDMNPMNDNPDEPRKIVRGGSWKDVAYFLETGTRGWEYEDNKRSFIGFRCVVENLAGRAATSRGRRR
ncbi:type IX secretion system lipoprotein PorK/GldK [Runella slithyformis]|uniref:Sulphatase-modifying factor protein n=1 Tax=Runella slithyformis (strain ATCC 29530 / DSM 19594 / LMG 11500 / NCIMB 11436 / LSU 4) TaxID=761193 RepID=A0A7U3ZMD2_RUNSL|nr:SUMF1/EgtB/PvdO family nonheme iron enzyme [Runella slithyformis]AEI49880.1 Sulphatase-modifying factor protein [Runella slithyformis DSM 19594]